MHEVVELEGGIIFDNPEGLGNALKTIKNYAMVGGKYKIQLQDCPQLTPA